MTAFEKKAEGIYYLEVPFGGCWTGIALIKGKYNYLVDSAGSTACVNDYLVPALAKLGMSLSDIDYLLNTHTHADHVGGHAFIKASGNGIVTVTSKESADKLRDPLKYNKLIRAVFPEHSPAPSAGLVGIEPDLIIEDGYVLQGEMLYVSTPGHDTDSGCWMHLPTRTLISGDSLQLNGTSVQGIALYMDLCAYRESIEKLLALGIKRILAGHEYLPLGAYAEGVDACKKYLSKCQEYIDIYDGIIKKLSERGADAPAIAKALIKEVDGTEPEYLFLPLYTVTEHIKNLKKHLIIQKPTTEDTLK